VLPLLDRQNLEVADGAIIGGPMLALALPVIDTLIVMKQRFGGEKRPILQRIGTMFNADRRHIHHILVARFGSTSKASFRSGS